MAKKSAHSEEELPFAALMDVMTNVVGVLIIVLVLSGISLAQVAKKIIAQIEIISQEDFDKLKKQSKAATPNVDPSIVAEEIKTLEEQLKRTPVMERPPIKVDQKLADLDALKLKVEEKRKERDKEKEDVSNLLAKIDELKKRLDTKPRYVPPPIETMKLPNPRPMTGIAITHTFFVSGNEIFYVDDGTNYSKLIETLQKAENALGAKPINWKGKDGNPVMWKNPSGKSVPRSDVTFERPKIIEFLKNNLKLGPGKGIRFVLDDTPWNPVITYAIYPERGSGMPINEATQPNSPYFNIIKSIASKNSKDGVAFFHVFEDGMETFIKAREIADRLKVNVGWDMEQRYHINADVLLDGKRFTMQTTAERPVDTTPWVKPLIEGRAGATID